MAYIYNFNAGPGALPVEVLQEAHAELRSFQGIGATSSDIKKKLLVELEQEGFMGLKGHRDAGHLRASIYNAVPYEHCKALADFLSSFQERNG